MILDILFPPNCIICSKFGDYICKECANQLFRSLPRCYGCKKLNTSFLTHQKCRYMLDVNSVFTMYTENSYTLLIDELVLKGSQYLPIRSLLILNNRNEAIKYMDGFTIEYIKDRFAEINKVLKSEILRIYKPKAEKNRILLVGYKLQDTDKIKLQILEIRRIYPECIVKIFLLFGTI